MTEIERAFRAGLLEGMEVENERIVKNLARQLDRETDPMARIMLKSLIELVKGDSNE